MNMLLKENWHKMLLYILKNFDNITLFWNTASKHAEIAVMNIL